MQLLLAVSFVLLCSPRAGSGEPHRVVYISPSNEDSVASLMQAELRTAGFLVVSRRSAGALLGDVLEQTARETGSLAAIAVEPSGEGLMARVWIAERSQGPSGLHELTVPSRSEEDARLLSLRVAELLHASVLELSEEEAAQTGERDVSGHPGTAAPTQTEDVTAAQEAREGVPAAAPIEAPARDTPERAPPRNSIDEQRFSSWAMGVGPGVFGGPGGMPVGIAPLMLLSWQATASGAVEIVASGPALGTVNHELGTATVDQELVFARARVALPAAVWSPYLGAGAGAYRIGAHGDAAEPHAGRYATQVAFLSALGLGLRWHATRNLRILAEMDGAFITPRPVLRFGGRSSAATATPLLLGTVALELGW